MLERGRQTRGHFAYVDTTEWAKGLKSASKNQTLSPRRFCDDGHDRGSTHSTIGFNDILDFLEFEVDEVFSCLGSISVELVQHNLCFVVAIFLAEPARTLLEKPDTDAQSQGWDALECKRETPCES